MPIMLFISKVWIWEWMQLLAKWICLSSDYWSSATNRPHGYWLQAIWTQLLPRAWWDQSFDSGTGQWVASHLGHQGMTLFVSGWILIVVTDICWCGAMHGVTVSTSAFLACHKCCCVGSSLAWGLNLRALVCGIFLSLSPGVFSRYSGFLPSLIG